MNSLVLIKIGGSLITDKTKPLTVREDMMRVVAQSIRAAYEKYPETGFILANGAGSFGHYLASRKAGDTPQERVEAVHESVVLLNRIFVQHLSEAGLPVTSIIPATKISATNGVLKDFDIQEVEDVLSLNSIPVLFGDIVDDGTDKGMIFSTETLFEILADKLQGEYDIDVIYAGETAGVLDVAGATIPEISSSTWENLDGAIEAPEGYDVTGGMRHKVESALRMTRFAKNVHILSGSNADVFTRVLAGESVGTRILS